MFYKYRKAITYMSSSSPVLILKGAIKSAIPRLSDKTIKELLKDLRKLNVTDVEYLKKKILTAVKGLKEKDLARFVGPVQAPKLIRSLKEMAGW